MPDPANPVKKRLRTAVRNPRGALRVVRRNLRSLLPNVAHAGNRSTGRVRDLATGPVYEKRFSQNAEPELLAELEARRRWADEPWMVPILGVDERAIRLPRLPDDSRVDRIAPRLATAERREIARGVLHAALDMFADGFAHRDLQSKNVFWRDGQVYLIDFEVMAEYPPGSRSSFAESYDVVGRGLDSPHETHGACYGYDHPASLATVLGVPVPEALGLVRDDLAREARDSSLSFKRRAGRHECAAGATYTSIRLPHLTIGPQASQRDCTKRFEQLGVRRADLEGRSVLDLGCNIGGMLFEASWGGPSRLLGVEYDADKVRTASRLAAFGGIADLVEFRRADVDSLDASSIGPFDVVFCFAIEAHVKRPDRLLSLIAEVCTERLYFEGNSTTDGPAVARRLRELGFPRVEELGVSTDDARPENHNRPLLVASKA